MANALRAPCCDSPRTPRTYPCAQCTTSNHPTLFPHSQETTHCKTELACGKGGASTTCQLLLQRRALRNSLPLSPEASAMRSWNSQLIVAITITEAEKLASRWPQHTCNHGALKLRFERNPAEGRNVRRLKYQV